MQVICTDGTVIECERFEAIDSGVLLFGEERTARAAEDEEEEEEAAEHEEAFGFVPIHSVRYVLPEGALGPRGAGQPQQPAPTGAGQGAPPGGQQSYGGPQPGPQSGPGQPGRRQ